MGLSEVGVADVEHARRVLPIVSVQNRYSLIDRQSEDVLDYCEREGIVFIPWYALGAGTLGKNEQAARARLHRVARRLGASELQVGLAWLFARSSTVLNIPGTSKVEHLEENVAAARPELSEGDVRELNRK